MKVDKDWEIMAFQRWVSSACIGINSKQQMRCAGQVVDLESQLLFLQCWAVPWQTGAVLTAVRFHRLMKKSWASAITCTSRYKKYRWLCVRRDWLPLQKDPGEVIAGRSMR